MAQMAVAQTATLQFLDQLRHDFKEICNEANVRNLEDERIWTLPKLLSNRRESFCPGTTLFTAMMSLEWLRIYRMPYTTLHQPQRGSAFGGGYYAGSTSEGSSKHVASTKTETQSPMRRGNKVTCNNCFLYPVLAYIYLGTGTFALKQCIQLERGPGFEDTDIRRENRDPIAAARPVSSVAGGFKQGATNIAVILSFLLRIISDVIYKEFMFANASGLFPARDRGRHIKGRVTLVLLAHPLILVTYNIPRKAHLEDVLEFTRVAASTARELSVSAKIPFLGGASVLGVAIVDIIRGIPVVEVVEIMEQIQETFITLIILYESTQIMEVLPPNILSQIVDFTECLRSIHVYVKAKQGMGRLRHLLDMAEKETQIEACRAELLKMLDTFWISATLSGTTGSSLSISMLPPALHIFHGRESELREVVELLKAGSLEYILPNPQTVWSTSRMSTIRGPVVSAIGSAGLEMRDREFGHIPPQERIKWGMGKTSLAQVALYHVDVTVKYSERYFVPCHSSITHTDLISAISTHIGFGSAQDSQEPISTRSKVEELLSLLAAHQVLMDIAEDHRKPEKVRQLLDLTDNLPLAVTLMVMVIGYEGCDRTISRWKEENTHLLSDGYDQHSSLDISTMLSYSGLRMTHGAQQLLSLLSILPDGLSDADLIHSGFLIENILACKSALIQVSLAHVDNSQCLKSLVPLREYIQRDASPTQWEVTLESVIHLSQCLRFAQLRGSGLMVELWPQVMLHPGTAN
ncbi:hypothetical protein C8J57DRAFT_1650067 [Mycena rebaudengoi]|nr:hypothetical protein C8J57DRAFT_1650067 [Mycena rebaudengoi]